MWSALLISLLSVAPSVPAAAAAPMTADSQSVILELHPSQPRFRGATEVFATLADSTRLVALVMRGLEPARVEMQDALGRVDLVWGERPAGTLLLEARRAIVPGPVRVRIAYDGTYADSGAGLVRTGRGHRTEIRSAFMDDGAAAAFPLLAGGAAQCWSLTIETPLAWELHTNLGRGRAARAEGFRTTRLRTGRAMPADSLRIEVRPRSLR